MANDRTGDAAEREGFGDDQGTRVGSPTPGGSGEPGHLRATEGALDEERETAIDEPGRSATATGSGEAAARTPAGGGGTGMGSEAAEGVHSTGGRSPSAPSGLQGAETGRGDSGGVDRAGSEPLGGRTTEHKGSYGGEGGEPRGE